MSFALKRGWGVLLGVPALFLVAFLYPRLPFLPDATLCAVRGFLGVPCPGCGLTHSFVALVQGRVRASVDAHPLGIVIALWLCYLMGRYAIRAMTGRRPPELLTQRQRDWCLFAFLAALFAQWAVHLILMA